MEEGIKFTDEALLAYILVDFAKGKDFVPAYHRLQLVRRDAGGSPTLRSEFVGHMDDTTYDLRFPYEQIAAIYNSMYSVEAECYQAQRLNYLHKTWTWLSFERRQGVIQARFSERMQVDDRTIGRWKRQVIRYIREQLTSPPEPLVFPATYALATAPV